VRPPTTVPMPKVSAAASPASAGWCAAPRRNGQAPMRATRPPTTKAGEEQHLDSRGRQPSPPQGIAPETYYCCLTLTWTTGCELASRLHWVTQPVVHAGSSRDRNRTPARLRRVPGQRRGPKTERPLAGRRAGLPSRELARAGSEARQPSRPGNRHRDPSPRRGRGDGATRRPVSTRSPASTSR
jgi:hypothetical protein